MIKVTTLDAETEALLKAWRPEPFRLRTAAEKATRMAAFDRAASYYECEIKRLKAAVRSAHGRERARLYDEMGRNTQNARWAGQQYSIERAAATEG